MQLIAVRTGLMATFLTATLFLAGCGSDDSEASEDTAAQVSTPAPQEHYLQVVVSDEGGLDVYFNKNDKICTVSDALTGVGEAPTVTVRSAAGEIIATEEMPREGGEFQPGGCVVRTDVKVPLSDFYEVALTGGNSQADEAKTIEFSGDHVKSGTQSTIQLVIFRV